MLGHGLILVVLLAIPMAVSRQGVARAAARPSARTAFIIKPFSPVGPGHREPVLYTVRPGDVLGAIAANYELRVETLRATNDIPNVDALQPGQQLLIPPTNGVLVRVAAGDTLVALAQRYHVDPSAVIAYNNIPNPEQLTAGSLLMLPDGTGLQPAPTPSAPAPKLKPKAPAAPAPARILGTAGHFPYGYCTYWVAIHRYIPWMGNANQWLGAAQRLGWATGMTPRVGAIMTTRESGWGHVALVEAVYPDGSWDVNEMNYKGWGIVDHRHIRPGGVPLMGFIY